MAAPNARVRRALDTVLAEARPHTEGAVADYIPQLALADPDGLGIALVGVKGRTYEAGDSRREFTIQSVSKPFVYALALEARGVADLSPHVGVEPSGEAFNEASFDGGRPMNPMINAGAIVVASLIDGVTAQQKAQTILDGLGAFAGRTLAVDDAVFRSELATGDRNRELAGLAHGVLGSSEDVATEAYFVSCMNRLWVRSRSAISSLSASSMLLSPPPLRTTARAFLARARVCSRLRSTSLISPRARS